MLYQLELMWQRDRAADSALLGDLKVLKAHFSCQELLASALVLHLFRVYKEENCGTLSLIA